MYFASFGRRRTSSSSSSVAPETRSRPLWRARSKARRGVDQRIIRLLTTTPVSKTNRTSLLLQNASECLGRQALCSCRTPDLIQDLIKWSGRPGGQLPQTQPQEHLKLTLLILRCSLIGFCSRGVDGYRDNWSAHSLNYTDSGLPRSNAAGTLFPRGSSCQPSRQWQAARCSTRFLRCLLVIVTACAWGLGSTVAGWRGLVGWRRREGSVCREE